MTTADVQKHDAQQRGVNDTRLAVYATSSQPAWLWSLDGARILWANPVGAALFGARHGPALAAKPLGPADARRRQVAQLARRLRADGGVRLERLRAFGAPLGRLVACACSRMAFPDGLDGILIVAAEPVGRAMPLVERLQRLVEGIDAPIAAFGRDGLFVGASDAARALMAFRTLSDAGLESARDGALKDGRVEMPIGVGQIVLQRVGSGADIGLVALMAPGTAWPAQKPAIVEAEKPTIAAPELPKPEVAEIHESEQVFVDEFAAETVAADSSEPRTYTAAADDSGDLLVEPLPDHITNLDVTPAKIDLAGTGNVSDPVANEPDDFDDEAKIVRFLRSDDAIDQVVVESNHDQPPLKETPHPIDVPPLCDEDVAAVEPATPVAPLPPPTPRRNPLRFTWAIDNAGLFTLRSDDFLHLIGPKTAARFGRSWSDIADDLKLDLNGRVAAALASHTTWSGIDLAWPVDPPGEALPVEMAGLPVFADGQFSGYRGFGVSRDLDALERLDAIRHGDHPPNDDNPPRSLSAQANPQPELNLADAPAPAPSSPIEPMTPDIEDSVARPQSAPLNVVPIRPLADPVAPVLTPVENNAFNELARQLSARLDSDDASLDQALVTEPTETASAPAFIADTGDWLSRPPALAQGAALRDRPLLDLMPAGVLVYRLDRLLYANPAFLARTGHADLAALEIAGGLDSLYIEPGVSIDSSSAGTGTFVTIAAKADHPPATANLSSISWDGEPALALIFTRAPPEPVTTVPASIDSVAPAVPEPGHASAEDLAAILDTAAEGIVMFDASGKISSCNRSAEALFGRDGRILTTSTLVDLFAPESQSDVQNYLDAVARGDASNMHGRDVLGRVPSGGLLPLAITMGRTTRDGPNFFAIFRDQSQARKIDSELLAARKQADRFVSAKADVLARISHEIRTPLNAIIGFSDVMIGERFGALGNPRYGDYLKDIRACGERVIAIIDDMLNLAKIETGDLDLAFASQNLNELVEQCVAVMQPQANRERIIIRTSLAHHLPPVQADARALRQITLNLISNSIHLANAGGQVIVSTAISDLGDIVLRVRDTGHGLNDNEIAAAMEPFRTRAPADRGPETAGVNLSLTRALVEANRAQFNIKTGPQSGTLIEVVFSLRTAAISS